MVINKNIHVNQAVPYSCSPYSYLSCSHWQYQQADRAIKLGTPFAITIHSLACCLAKQAALPPPPQPLSIRTFAASSLRVTAERAAAAHTNSNSSTQTLSWQLNRNVPYQISGFKVLQTVAVSRGDRILCNTCNAKVIAPDYSGRVGYCYDCQCECERNARLLVC